MLILFMNGLAVRMMFGVNIIKYGGCGGIGRHAGLWSRCLSVRVQVPSITPDGGVLKLAEEI